MSTHAQTAPLMLSVSGARGIVGRTMTPVVAATFAGAFASHLGAAPGGERRRIVVGRDSRPSGAMLASAAMAGLAGVGVEAVDLGIVATPTVGVMVDELRADGGLVLTASHNPTPWNGLKCLVAPGVAPPAAEAEAIIERFRAGDVAWVGATEVGRLAAHDGANDVHLARVLAAVDVAAIRARAFTVVLDSVNGAGGPAGAALLAALGCTVIHLNPEPHGRFAHTPEPLEENLRDLAAETGRTDAAVGFAQDPDADRLAFVDETGRYVGEEYTLVVCAQRRLERAGGRGVLVANLSTSRMIDALAARYDGARVERSAVGEANVAEVMARHDALLGGEGNGGVIDPAVGRVRDSLVTMALVLDALAATDAPLSRIVDDLPRFAMVKEKLEDVEASAIAPALERVRRHYEDDGADVSTVDGVRIDRDEGWVHLRPSNTEPIVRAIAEADDAAGARALVDEVRRVAGL